MDHSQHTATLVSLVLVFVPAKLLGALFERWRLLLARRRGPRRTGEGRGILHREGGREIGALVGPGDAVLGVPDRGGESHVGGCRVENPEALTDAAGVEHLDEHLGVAGAKEPEQSAGAHTEVRVKVLGACSVSQSFWVFY